MRRILIIEDEKLSADRLKRLMQDIDDTTEICGPLASVDEVVAMMRSNERFDLIFSDIRLKDCLVFEAFHEAKPTAPVLFTTAFDEYALEAFRNNGVDYLLKPISAEDLSSALAKVSALKADSTDNASNIYAAAREMKCYKKRFLVAKGDELVILRTDDISFMRIEGNNVMAYDEKGEAFKLSMTMNEVEEQLSPESFFRLNRQYIANINCIRKISFFFSSKLVVRLKGCEDEQIVVSKEKSAQFKQWLDR